MFYYNNLYRKKSFYLNNIQLILVETVFFTNFKMFYNHIKIQTILKLNISRKLL